MTIVAAIPVTIKSASSIFQNNGEKKSENIFQQNNAQFFKNKTVSFKNFCPCGERSTNIWTFSFQPHWKVCHVVWPVHPRTNICFQHFLQRWFQHLFQHLTHRVAAALVINGPVVLQDPSPFMITDRW